MGFISRDLVWKGVKKDTVLVKEGGKYEGLYLLLEGKCEVVGKEKRWVVSGEGVFGEKELWEERVSEEMVKCKTDCEFLVVAREEFQKEKRRVEVEANKNILCVLKKVPLPQHRSPSSAASPNPSSSSSPDKPRSSTWSRRGT